ncbi:MAG TPA: tetratricopeptide repeat protein [Chitinophagales bacterium]|nr:tetratricopeptide repeat protein [Chitinophagales bacterium]
MSKKKKRTSSAPVVSATGSTRPSSERTLSRLLMIMCALFAFALYANTLSGKFTVDDDLVISKNKFTHEGISALPKILTTSYRAGFYDRKEGLYRPLSVALFAVEWQLAPENPFVFHLVNVLLYALTAAVLFLFLRDLLQGKNLILPFLLTILFAAHPVHTEVVANVKSGDEVLAFLFSILSLWFVLKFVKSTRMVTMVLAGFFYMLAVLSKETAITMVIVAPLMLYFFSNPKRNQWIITSAFLVSLVVIYFVIRTSVLKGISNLSSVELINNSLVSAGDDLMKREATAIYMLGKYILLLFFPVTLCYDYSYNTIPIVSFSDVQALLSLVVIIALAVIAMRGIRKKDPVSFGILFFGITIGIVTNIFFLIESTFAERFLYMPSFGFCIAIVFLFAKLFKIQEKKIDYTGFTDLLKRNRSLSLFFSIVIILFSVKTFSRNLNWRSNLILLTHDVMTHPNSARIQYSMGSTYIFELAEKEKDADRKKELLQKGINHLQEGIKLIPYYGDAWFNQGYAYSGLGDYKDAVHSFDEWLAHSEKADVSKFISAGLGYAGNNDFTKAIAMFDSAIARNDTSFDAYNNKGMFESRTGQYESAVINLKKAIQLKPNQAEAYYNLGNNYAYQQNYSVAIEYYKQALERNPQFEIAMENMGNSYAASKQYDEALKTYQKILEINPNNQQARTNMGITYRILGDSAKAREFLPNK